MTVVPKKKSQKLSQTKEVDDWLKDIYGSKNNQDLSKIERRKKSRVTSFLLRSVIVLFFLAFLSWGGFIWWQSNSHPVSDKILQAGFEVPSIIVSGEPLCFKLNYQNTGRVPLASLAVSINLPNTFSLKQTTPSTTETNHWILSPLNANSDDSINICGTFKASIPIGEKLQAVFTYRPANFSSDFQDIIGQEIAIDKSILESIFTGPTEAVVGDEANYSLKLKNSGTEKTENIQIRLRLPESFSVKNTEPVFSQENSGFWNIASLEAESEQEIKFTGTFTNSASGLIPIVVETGFLDANQNFIKQNETKVETNVLGSELSFHLIINGSEKDQTVDLGSRLRFSLDYTNQGKETLKNVSFILETSNAEKSVPINFFTYDLSGGQPSENTVTWNQENTINLTSLEPKATGIIDAIFTLPTSISPDYFTDSVSLQIKATIGQIGGITTARTISSTPLIIKINSDAVFFTEARYYDRDGVPVGSGPLPPKVEETTTYRIFWTIQNSLHDLKNSSTTMTLPAKVAWTNNVQADNGSIAYNETTRQITWKIDSLKKETKTTSAWFDVAILPETKDIGSFFQLANPTAFEATDTITNDSVHDSVDALTTALPNDDLVAGKGVVE